MRCMLTTSTSSANGLVTRRSKVKSGHAGDQRHGSLPPAIVQFFPKDVTFTALGRRTTGGVTVHSMRLPVVR